MKEILLFITLCSFLLITLVSGNFGNLEGGFYGGCSTFSCGNITGVGFPFRSHVDPELCGYPGLVLQCKEDNITTIEISNMTYNVLSVDQNAQQLRIVREDVFESTCPQKLVNTSLDHDLFDYVPTYMNLSFLYGCHGLRDFPGRTFPSCENIYVADGVQGPGSCNVSVIVPISLTYSKGSSNSSNWDQAVKEGFEVRLKVDGKACNDCKESNGHCGYNLYASQTTCYCPNPPYVGQTCSAATTAPSDSDSPPSTRTNQGITGNGSSKTNTLTIVLPVVGAILAGMAIGWLFFFCRQRRKRRAGQSAYQTESGLPSPLSTKQPTTTNPSTTFTRSIPSYSSTKSEFGKSNYFGLQVFTYAELEKATDNFDSSKELGNGGFGSVYYGKLVDGREVAVKLLYENNFKRLEQFINEVEILTQLKHENLVKLYGCTSKRSRELLLVYEYISNGTVADHLHGKRPNSVSGLLSWPVRLNIAIETACALSYLHDSDIIHRDVKTNNILLDNNFRVKVADFGLSRLFPNDATHVSTAPQGTPGYVDPEYFQCYQLTDKSDVYSFGVVLIELLSSLEAVDTNRHRLHINLSNMAVDKIQNHMLHELVDKTLGFETDNMVRRMTTLVAELAFRCLQQDKDMRPPMKEVLEILRGIQNNQFNGQNPEILDIVVDNGAQMKDIASPPSPASSVTDRLVSTPNSSG